VERQWQLGTSRRAHAHHGRDLADSDWTAWRTTLEAELVRANDRDEAAAIADRHARARARYELALQLSRSAPASDALEALGEALVPDARLLRAALLRADGHADEAIQELARVVEQTPLDATAQVALALARAEAGEVDAAHADLESFAASLADAGPGRPARLRPSRARRARPDRRHRVARS
jgi:tetratricopeptide (TPR) repeat protein